MIYTTTISEQVRELNYYSPFLLLALKIRYPGSLGPQDGTA